MSRQQLEPKERSIGGRVYQVRMLPADEGLRSAAKLVNLIGPGVKALQSGDENGFMAFASELMSSDKLADQLEYFTKLFRKHSAVQLEGADGFVELATIWEFHFSGNYFELLQWLVFCFEVNHASFLTGAGVSVQKVVGLIQGALSSRYRNPAAKPGSSGGSSSLGASTKPTNT